MASAETITRTAWWRYALLVVFMIIWTRMWAVNRDHPTIYGDEIQYIYKAYVWNQFNRWSPPDPFPDIGTHYPPLYSRVIGFALRGCEPVTSYRRVLVTNSILLAVGIAAWTYALSKRYKHRASIAVGGLSGILCAYSAYGTSAMSEALFNPLFLILSALILCFASMEKWGLFGIAIISFSLVMTRKMGVALIVSVPASLFVCVGIKEWRKALMGSVFAVIGCIVAWYIVVPVLGITASGQTLTGYWQEFWRNRSALGTLRPLLGQIAYLHIASGCMLPLAMLWVYDRWQEQDRVPAALMVLCVPLIVPGLVHMYIQLGLGRMLPRYHMYGRYVDMVVPLVASAGVLRMLDPSPLRKGVTKTYTMSILITSLVFGLIAFGKIEGIHILNVGVAWVAAVQRMSRTVAFVLLVAISLWISWTVQRKSLYHRIVSLSFFVAMQLMSLYAVERVHARLQKNQSSAIDAFMAARNEGATVSPHEYWRATTTQYRAKYVFAHRFLKKRPDHDGMHYYLHESGRLLMEDDKITCLDLCQLFPTATFVTGYKAGTEIRNPWNRTIICGPVEGVGSGIVMIGQRCEIRFDGLVIPNESGVLLNVGVVFFPNARRWNVSDGQNARIFVHTDDISTAIFDQRIFPGDDLKEFLLPLEYWKGKVVSISLSTHETTGNGNGDWLVWGWPRIQVTLVQREKSAN